MFNMFNARYQFQLILLAKLAGLSRLCRASLLNLACQFDFTVNKAECYV